MSTYLGFPVLDETTHNMREAIAQFFDRRGAATKTPTGRRVWTEFTGVPTPSRSFEWFASGRTEIAALRAFLDARKGRLTACWVPTYCWDLSMTQDELSTSASLRVTNVGYGTLLFPYTARKYLAVVQGNGTFLRRKVSLVTDNLDGTETLSLDAQHGVTLAAASTLVCYLTLCRLDQDLVPIRWIGGGEHAEASIPFREVPREVPA